MHIGTKVIKSCLCHSFSLNDGILYNLSSRNNLSLLMHGCNDFFSLITREKPHK